MSIAWYVGGLLIVVVIVIVIAGCVSVYLISDSPNAQMERGEGNEPFSPSVKVDRNKSGTAPPSVPESKE